MTDGLIAFLIVFGFLQIYAALAAIDFGAGGLYLWAWLRGDRALSDAVIQYMSPVWETTGVFLICFVVGMVAFFPGAVELYSSALLVPATVAVALLVVRGIAFTHAHHTGRPGWPTALSFGLSSLLIPVFLGPFFTVTEVGLRPGGEELHAWTHPLTLGIAAVGLAYMGALSATFLAFWVERQGQEDVAARFARLGAIGNLLTVPTTGGLLVALQTAAPYHFGKLAALWPMGILIGALAVASSYLVRKEGAGRALAFGGSMAGFVIFFAAYGFTRLPYLVYPTVTVDSALTSPAMFQALLATLVVGVLLVGPALGALTYFTLRGKAAER